MSSVTIGRATTNYTSNGLNQRVRKSGPGGSFNYVYAPDGTLLGETSSGGTTLTTQYIWMGGMPIGIIRNGTLYYVHDDHLGRPEQVTNSAGTIVWQAQNLPYSRNVTTNTFGGLNIGFPGQYFDSESNLYYNLNRYYDPSMGRYLESDPAGLMGGVNTYIYADENPLSLIDLNGLDTYVVSRDLSAFGTSARPLWDPLTHTFTFSTNTDGSIASTYSWGNAANLTGWNLNQPEDIAAAREALQKGYAVKIGPSFVDPYYRRAFNTLNNPINDHRNGVIVNNCKSETVNLNHLATSLMGH